MKRRGWLLSERGRPGGQGTQGLEEAQVEVVEGGRGWGRGEGGWAGPWVPPSHSAAVALPSVT